jgi:lysophospholipase L1-like esterase
MRAPKSFLLLILLTSVVHPVAATDTPANHWVATWSASPQRAGAPLQVQAQTLRQIVHTSLGGSAVRVRISNAYGITGLVIGAAHVALSAGGASVVGGSDRILTFGGSPTITIPPGALAVSDVVQLEVPALGDLAVSLHFPEAVTALTEHTEGLQTTYVSGQGNFTGAGTLASQTTTHNFYFLSGVDVRVRGSARAVIAMGDSVTVGFGSTPDLNQRWTDLLAERLQSNPSTARVAVANAGVVGNRILHDLVGTSALGRLDRDVLVQTGAAYLIVLEGDADFLIPGAFGLPAEEVSVAQVIQGYRQIIDRARAVGLLVYGSPLNPLEGYPFPGFWTAAREEKRQAVNQWIRTSGAFDAVIDFDAVLRDPSHPAQLLPAYDSGDHVHPNDAGYRAMADAIDLSLFEER